MNLVMLSDPHMLAEKTLARKDDVDEVGWGKLHWVYDFAYKKAAHVLIAGDLTDGPRSWALLPRLTNFYREVSQWPDWLVRTYVVRGQHDVYMRNTNMNQRTIMGVLSEAGLITELGVSPTRCQTAALYGCSWGEEHYEYIKTDPRMLNVLVIHAPICDQSQWEGQNYLDAQVFLNKHPQFDIILCGDIHRKFALRSGSRWIVNTGPMIRKEADPYNFTHEPAVWYYEDDKLFEVTIPHASAEHVLNRDHIERQQARIRSTLDMNEFVEKVKAARSDSYKATTFENNLRHLLHAGNPSALTLKILEQQTKWKLKPSTSQRVKA